MSDTFPLPVVLPPAAGPAVAIVRRLASAGHQALLAGGCVRDLLLGQTPSDYDVATDAPPDRVRALFPAARLVGAQFGVVLVKRGGRWTEVATFRADGPYRDGRHPTAVRFTTAQEDARRRDFTVNGMFLDPLRLVVIDHVCGRADLDARLIRAIGEPAARFEEDHLRLLRAVRFAARLDFAIEPATLAAIRVHAAKLASVAAERVREELEKTLAHPSRRRAFHLLAETGLLPFLWRGASWRPEQAAAAEALLSSWPARTSFEQAFAGLVADRRPAEIREIGRALTFSNEQLETVLWLTAHQADLDDPAAISLASLKRLIASPVFAALRQWAEVRYAAFPDGRQRSGVLAQRLASIPPESVRPAPLVNGDDVTALGVPPGPIYKEVLDDLYTRQLDERVRSRDEALVLLQRMLRARGAIS